MLRAVGKNGDILKHAAPKPGLIDRFELNLGQLATSQNAATMTGNSGLCQFQAQKPGS